MVSIRKNLTNPNVWTIVLESFEKESECIKSIIPPSLLSVHTHKVLPDIIEVFAVLLQRILKQVCLWRTPFLHLIPAKHGPTLRNKHAQSTGEVIAVPVQGVHGMELKRARLTDREKINQVFFNISSGYMEWDRWCWWDGYQCDVSWGCRGTHV